MPVQMTIKESAAYPQSVEQVWNLCGVPGEIDRWLPAVEKSWSDGDVRYADLVGGAGQARERVTEHSDEQHYYVYDYLDGPMVLTSFSSKFAVVPSADGGSEILWTAEFLADNEAEGAELAQAVSGMYQGGLQQIKTVLESGKP
jgi:hypothetical protein